jgi:hypothetical protein
LDIIKLGSLYSLKIYLTKYLATKIALINFIEIIYRIFIRWLTTTIIFVNLLPLNKSTIKSIIIIIVIFGLMSDTDPYWAYADYSLYIYGEKTLIEKTP